MKLHLDGVVAFAELAHHVRHRGALRHKLHDAVLGPNRPVTATPAATAAVVAAVKYKTWQMSR